MEFILINEWYSYWYATLVLGFLTAVDIMIFCAVVFLLTIVYDIYNQVTTKWAKPKATPKTKA